MNIKFNALCLFMVKLLSVVYLLTKLKTHNYNMLVIF